MPRPRFAPATRSLDPPRERRHRADPVRARPAPACATCWPSARRSAPPTGIAAVRATHWRYCVAQLARQRRPAATRRGRARRSSAAGGGEAPSRKHGAGAHHHAPTRDSEARPGRRPAGIMGGGASRMATMATAARAKREKAARRAASLSTDRWTRHRSAAPSLDQNAWRRPNFVARGVLAALDVQRAAAARGHQTGRATGGRTASLSRSARTSPYSDGALAQVMHVAQAEGELLGVAVRGSLHVATGLARS
jgi:hypothetical protein